MQLVYFRNQSLYAGRARLGGTPVGVIAVESATVMLNVPADPGMPDSSERIIPQVLLLRSPSWFLTRQYFATKWMFFDCIHAHVPAKPGV